MLFDKNLKIQIPMFFSIFEVVYINKNEKFHVFLIFEAVYVKKHDDGLTNFENSF